MSEGAAVDVWIDVTRPLHAGHPTWPGDTPFDLRRVWRMEEGASVNVMALHTSTHVGTHLDAPYHYRRDGERLEAVPLGDLLGEAVVLDLRRAVADAHTLTEAALEALERVGSPVPARVFLRTGERDAWPTFPEGYAALEPELVAALAARGVRLLGTDAPSVDAFTSKDLPVHAACARHGVWIVEGLALANVDEGRYEAVVLPLRLVGADASPVRALLRRA